jgi:centromere protein J
LRARHADDDALKLLGGAGGGYFGYADAFAEEVDGSDADDGLGPSASNYGSEDVLDGEEGQYADSRGGYSDHDFDDRELDLEGRVAAAEAEAEVMLVEDEVAEAAVAQLRGHSREHAAAVLSSNPYFEQVGQDEGRPVQEDAHPDGKLERLYRSGRCEVLYATGTRKEVMPSGLHTVFFCNGDVKQTAPSRRVVYYHAEADTTHVSEPDGTQIYHFPNQQVERHFSDGLKEISFPDGTVKVILPNGDVQTIPTVSRDESKQPIRQPVGAR